MRKKKLTERKPLHKEVEEMLKKTFPKKKRRIKIMHPPCYMGLDMSINGTGVSVVDSMEKTLHTEVIEPPKKLEKFDSNLKLYIPNKVRAFDLCRYEYIIRRIISLIRNYQVKAVVIENYSFGSRNSRSLTKLAELGGILRIEVPREGAIWIEAATTTVKKFISGAGNCALTDIPLKVFQKWGEDFEAIKSSDRLDAAFAYSLAKFAYYLLSPEADTKKLKKYELQTLDTVRKAIEKANSEKKKD